MPAPPSWCRAEESTWLTGAAFRRQLQETAGPTGPSWSGTPLREALNNLARARHVAVLLDRRVDPGQRLELNAEGRPLEEVFDAISRDRGLGVSIFEPVVYLGPPQAALRLRTLIAVRLEEVEQLPVAERRKFLATAPLAWADFATPRDVLTAMTGQAGVRVAELDRVPHDLWAAASVPALNLVERLCLVLGQFDLTFQVEPDGRTIRPVPVPGEVAVVRSYPAGTRPEETARRLAALAPGAEVRVSGARVFVKGLVEDFERIDSPERPAAPPGTGPDAKPAKPVPVGQIRIDSLAVQNKPLRQVLDVLGPKLGLEFQIDEQALRQAGISLDQLVSFEVKNATVDRLLAEMLKPAGLSFHRRDRTVLVRPE